MRIVLSLLVVLAVLAGVGWALWRWTRTPEILGLTKPVWQEVAPGIALRTLRWSVTGTPQDVTVVRLEPARCTLRVVSVHTRKARPAEFAEQICPATGVAINASMFTPQGVPLGLLLSDGVTRQRPIISADWGGLFVVAGGKPAILAPGARLPRGATEGMQCKPRLVIDGRIPSFKAQPATRRSAVGIDASGRVVLATCGGALTMEEWAGCVRDALYCRDALYLDGGSSTQMAVRGAATATVSGLVPVPTFLVAEPKATPARRR
jgi:hypothetical protein